jgi:hypothetical protein
MAAPIVPATHSPCAVIVETAATSPRAAAPATRGVVWNFILFWAAVGD